MLFRKNKDEYDLFSQLDNYLIQHKNELNKNENTDRLKQMFESKINDWLLFAFETLYNKRKVYIPNKEDRIVLKKMILEEVESFKKQEPHFYEGLFLCCNKIRNNTTSACIKKQEKEIENLESHSRLFSINTSRQENSIHRVDLYSVDVEVYDVLDELLKHKEEEFRALLMLYMKQNNIKNDREWYAYTHITKHDFSKYKSGHHPSRDNTLKLAFGLHLSLEETQAFLSAAGYSLSSSCRRDIIIKFCIEKGINTRKTDDLLMHYNEKILFG